MSIKILLVDDHNIFREGLCSLLENENEARDLRDILDYTIETKFTE